MAFYNLGIRRKRIKRKIWESLDSERWKDSVEIGKDLDLLPTEVSSFCTWLSKLGFVERRCVRIKGRDRKFYRKVKDIPFEEVCKHIGTITIVVE
jgi:hypothetical protein